MDNWKTDRELKYLIFRARLRTGGALRSFSESLRNHPVIVVNEAQRMAGAAKLEVFNLR